MSRRAIIRIIWVTTVAFGLCLPAVAAVAAAPREAPHCCEVSVADFPGQFTAGNAPRPFSATFHNNSKQSINGLQLTFTFDTNGSKINGSQLHLQRKTENGSWHGVSVSHHGDAFSGTDNLSGFGDGFPGGASATWQYQMWFSEKAPNSHLELVVTAAGRGFGFTRAKLATSPAYQTFVIIAAPPAANTPTPTPTPPKSTPAPTPTPTPTKAAAPTQTAEAPPDTAAQTPAGLADTAVATDSGGGLMWLAYTIGALLLLGGIAAIGTMVWRRGPRQVETEWPEDDYEPPPDPYAAPLPPTQYNPVVPGQHGTSFDAPTTPGPGIPAQVDPTRTMPR